MVLVPRSVGRDALIAVAPPVLFATAGGLRAPRKRPFGPEAANLYHFLPHLFHLPPDLLPFHLPPHLPPFHLRPVAISDTD
eukprot:CAMPEP_0197629130 /NCGR_PEP_ID=MMETSP1338-20131121/7120_1 /TAXON_ID=43686 ORGANISM="Pelagodinium beii, Strain RCC1491" /NCGR_SAMPLE_ID=MMETSP1338 /ASSEMBLY_ACC=CAM_ASM_000754 /LENGTH=80 /DNA_ID=CAMNT_0043200147 /DNA_START=289 /DNA_END=528 /DNA_ORIENTATION=+